MILRRLMRRSSEAMKEISGVMARGRWYSRGTLAGWLDAIEGG